MFLPPPARSQYSILVTVRVRGTVRCRVTSRLRVGVGVRLKVGFKDSVGVQSGQNGQGGGCLPSTLQRRGRKGGHVGKGNEKKIGALLVPPYVCLFGLPLAACRSPLGRGTGV